MLEIPAEVFADENEAKVLSNVDYIAYSLITTISFILLISYPFSLCNTATAYTYILHSKNREARCFKTLKIALYKVNGIWLFSTYNLLFLKLIDYFKKGIKSGIAIELIKDAWQICTLGIFPGMVLGDSFAKSCKNSLQMLKEQTTKVLLIHYGLGALLVLTTSALLIINALLGSYFSINPDSSPAFFEFAYITTLLTFCLIYGVFFATAKIVMSCDLYLETFNHDIELDKHLDEISNDNNLDENKLWGLLVYMAILIVHVLCLMFKDQLGITEFLQFRSANLGIMAE
jgi:hypothetical protein